MSRRWHLPGRGRRAGRIGLGLVTLGLVGLLGGCYTMAPHDDLSWMKYTPPPRLSPSAPRATRNLAVFDWVWRTIDANYYDPGFHGVDWRAARARHRPAAEAAKDDTQLYAAINAMLGELHDSHTRALSPRAVAELRERHEVWIGFDYAPLAGSTGRVVVTGVWPGGSAAAAGVVPGWILETCNGGAAARFLRAVRLTAGEAVDCRFVDNQNKKRSLKLVARSLERPPQRQARILRNGWVVLRFDGFRRRDARWLYRQVQDHEAAPVLILDLRYNPGGLTTYLEFIAGLFLPRGRLLGRYLRRGQEPLDVRSRRVPFVAEYRGRLAILVSHETASAAEIFTEAMRDDRRSIVVGQKTSGHVLNAYQAPLPDGGLLSFSIRDFRTPGGRRLEGHGIVPDHPVTYSLDEIRLGIDPAVTAAMRALQNPSAR